MASTGFVQKLASTVTSGMKSLNTENAVRAATGLPGYGGTDWASFAAHQLGMPVDVLKKLRDSGKETFAGPTPPIGIPAPAPAPVTIPASSGSSLGVESARDIISTLEQIESAEAKRAGLLITTLKRGFKLDEYKQPDPVDKPGAGGDSLFDRLERKLLGKKGRAGRVAKTRLGRAGQAVGRVLRSPLARAGGGILAGGIAAATKWWDVKDRDDLSTGQKAVQVGATGVGGAGGALGGAAAGAAIGSVVPVIGTAIGGLVGAAVGGWLGSKGGEMIGQKISDNYKTIVDSVKGGVNKLFGDEAVKAWDEKVNSVWDGITGFFGGLKDKVTDLGGKAATAVKEAAKATAEVTVRAASAVKEGAGRAYEATKAGASKAYEGGKEIVSNVKDWALGNTSKQFESGKGGAGTISTGKGDLGGKSYGTYQLTGGALNKFVKDGKYSESFRGMDVKSAEFDAKWKELAKNDPEFGKQQHDFIKKSHYDPQAEKLKKAGIDLSGRGAAVQDSIWSTSVQFGGQTDLIKKALQGKDVSKMSDAELVSAIQDYKRDNNDKLFKSSSEGVRAGTAKRAEAEKARLLALVKAEQDAPKVEKAEAPKEQAYPERAAVREAAAAPPATAQTGPGVSLRDVPLSPMDGMLSGVNTGSYNA
jgi:hypothetical protein